MALTFGERVALARKRARLSQEALGDAVNVHRNTVAGWEGPAATLPEGDAMVKLPGALGVSGHWLLTGEGEPQPEPLPAEAQAFREIAAIVDRAREAAAKPIETLDAVVVDGIRKEGRK